MSYTSNEQFGDLDVEVQLDHPEEGVSFMFETLPPEGCVSYKDFNADEYKQLLRHLLSPLLELSGNDRHRMMSKSAYDLYMLLAETPPDGVVF